MVYQIPDKSFVRLHHPRPRFKGNIEEVLIYMASEIARIGKKEKGIFNKELREAIRRFPGNLRKKEKTINNWRTEIDALLGLIQFDEKYCWPTRLAIELANEQDLVKFFKIFCYRFHYPSGAMKPRKVKELLDLGVNFRPAIYIVQLLKEAESKEGKRIGIKKSEATHCIFNDLRVVRDGRDVFETWELIKSNRESNIQYDWNGDIIRYAGDILDYLEQANILKRQPNSKYYLNHNEDLAIHRFISPDANFIDYALLSKPYSVISIKSIENSWINYLNIDVGERYFDTDVLALVSETKEEYVSLRENFKIEQLFDPGSDVNIGYAGESLIFNHEQLYLKKNDRKDLVHLVQRIPSNYAVGYDINSRDINTQHKMIEVKTTASSSLVNFSRFHLTPNEWSAAETHKENYYVYRLIVNKNGAKLHVIQNPVERYKAGELRIHPRDGIDITFDPKVCGHEAPLLITE
ncbi:protein NO VEIN domain-containing protein [Sporosarcina sp. FA15]|uniref:protein NO VEIN domain-containing protein n=1 Tax=Sporosarcina sp. FA15 TaxID=3413031 RepID=UPI003F65FDA0